MSQQSIKNLISPANQGLQVILKEVEKLNRWNSWFKESLPKENQANLIEHCKIVRLTGTTLIVVSDNAHWSMRLSFLIPEVIKKLKQYPDFKNLQKIDCKIKPPRYQKKAPVKMANLISKENAKQILEIAEKMETSDLREALERLGSHLKDSSHGK